MKDIKDGIKVLTCVDGSDTAKKTARISGIFTKHSNATLILVHVLDDTLSYVEIPDTPVYAERKKEGDAILKEAKEIVENEGATCSTRLLAGPIVSDIIRLAEKEECDVIFTGTLGRSGIMRMVLGSVAERIIRYAHCPVTVIR